MAAIRFFTIFITSVIVILWASSINGNYAEDGDYPFMVAIKYSNGNTFRCTGHIISPSWILARTRCFYSHNKTNYLIQYGLTKLSWDTANTVKIAELIPHPNYDPDALDNDVGLIKLERDLQFNAYTQAIKLPPKNYIPSIGRQCKSVGWFGDADTKIIPDLQVFSATIKSDSDCSTSHNFKLMYSRICTVHPFASAGCTYGGGTGLFLDNYIYGLLIQGSPCEATQDISVYIKITSYYDWIFGTIVKYELENFYSPENMVMSEFLKRLKSKLQSQLPEVYQISDEIIDFIARIY